MQGFSMGNAWGNLLQHQRQQQLMDQAQQARIGQEIQQLQALNKAEEEEAIRLEKMKLAGQALQAGNEKAFIAENPDMTEHVMNMEKAMMYGDPEPITPYQQAQLDLKNKELGNMAAHRNNTLSLARQKFQASHALDQKKFRQAVQHSNRVYQLQNKKAVNDNLKKSTELTAEQKAYLKKQAEANGTESAKLTQTIAGSSQGLQRLQNVLQTLENLRDSEAGVQTGWLADWNASALKANGQKLTPGLQNAILARKALKSVSLQDLKKVFKGTTSDTELNSMYDIVSDTDGGIDLMIATFKQYIEMGESIQAERVSSLDAIHNQYPELYPKENTNSDSPANNTPDFTNQDIQAKEFIENNINSTNPTKRKKAEQVLQMMQAHGKL